MPRPIHLPPWLLVTIALTGHGCRNVEPLRTDPRIGPQQGSYEFALGGAGGANDHLNGGGFSVAGSVGYYLQDDWILSLRQDATHSDSGDDTSALATRFALDWILPEGPLRPFVGANLGYTYGESINETIAIGPEVGVRYFLKPSTFIQGIIEWQLFFTTTEDTTEVFDDGALLYSIGLGVTF